MPIRVAHLKGACSDAVRLFKTTFPNGAEFPRDLAMTQFVGLDIEWARKNLGLILPRNEEIPKVA